MIYADFGSILISKNNKKTKPKEPYLNRYQKHFACIFHYKLIWADDLLSLLNDI